MITTLQALMIISEQVIVDHLGKQQCQHHKHDLLDPLAATLDGKLSADITACDGTQSSRQQQGIHGLAVKQPHNAGCNVGCHVGYFCAAAGNQQIQTQNTGECNNQESTCAGADHAVVAANQQTDTERSNPFHGGLDLFGLVFHAEAFV